MSHIVAVGLTVNAVTCRAWAARGHVRFWHKADMLNGLTNVCFGGKADMDQPLLTNLDL